MQTNAFRRSISMMAAIVSLMAATAGNFAAQRVGLDALGPYESRGKGKNRAHNRGGTKRHQRAATKARNSQRHRLACRG